MSTETIAAALTPRAQRAAVHARCKADAEARRERIDAQKHRALIRKGGLAGRRDVTTARCVTEDGLAFVSIEWGTDPFAPALFALQPATEGRGMIVVDHAAGAVVARGRDGAAALRAFSRTLPLGGEKAAR